MRNKRLINLIIGILLAALLIWLFLKDVDFNKVGESIAAANIWLLAVALFIQLLSLLLKGWRWQLLLSPVKVGIPISSCWKYLNIGFACTSLIPGRVGEFVRPYLLAKEQKILGVVGAAQIDRSAAVDLEIPGPVAGHDDLAGQGFRVVERALGREPGMRIRGTG